MIVIIGGGIIGTSIAYCLSKAGIRDITLIEKENLLGTGVTQYCSGGSRCQFSTPINVQFSIESFKDLRGYDIEYKKLGYLILDMKDNSMPRVKMQNSLGVKSEYLKPEEIKTRFPHINIFLIMEKHISISSPSRTRIISVFKPSTATPIQHRTFCTTRYYTKSD